MKCIVCQKRKMKAHANAKYCGPCAEALRKKPVGKLSDKQAATVRRLAGKVPQNELCEQLGTSKSNLRRWARDHGIKLAYFTHLKNNPAKVLQICHYYEKHGKLKTIERFPSLKIRSIVERYYSELGFKPRKTRWTSEELEMLVRMAGLIPFELQARVFNRPNAFAGSIRSAWIKKFGFGGGAMNGLSKSIAKNYVKDTCPYYVVDFQDDKDRRIALWVDVARHLKSGMPEHLRSAIIALSNFQIWIHGRNVRQSVANIMKEIYGEDRCEKPRAR